MRLLESVMGSLDLGVLLVGRMLGDRQCAIAPARELHGGQADSMRLQQSLRRLRHAFEDLAGMKSGRDFPELLTQIRRVSAGFASSFPEWMALVEALIQDAERSVGSAPGKGAYKADQVKAAIRYAHSREGRGLSGLGWPSLPFLEAAADIAIDFLVGVLNHQQMWVLGGAAAPGSGWLERLWQGFVRWATSLFGRIYAWLAPRASLSSALRQRVDAVLANRGDVRGLLQGTFEIVRYIGKHREQVVALSQVISIACTEAEAFQAMEGPEKRAYAREVVLLFLEDQAAGPMSNPVVRGCIGFFVECIIDTVVLLFNKRGVFSHASS